MNTHTLQRALWFAAAGSAVAVILFGRESKAATMKLPAPSTPPPPPPAPPPTAPAPFYGEHQKVALSVPGGWRRATGAEVNALPELRSRAVSLRNAPGFTSTPYGTLSSFTASDGNTYATWVEQHYHEPGGAAKPWGLHHGVTVLRKITDS